MQVQISVKNFLRFSYGESTENIFYVDFRIFQIEEKRRRKILMGIWTYDTQHASDSVKLINQRINRQTAWLNASLNLNFGTLSGPGPGGGEATGGETTFQIHPSRPSFMLINLGIIYHWAHRRIPTVR